MFRSKSAKAIIGLLLAVVVAAAHGQGGAAADIVNQRGRATLLLSMSPPASVVGQLGGIYVTVSDGSGFVRYLGSNGISPVATPIETGPLPARWERQIELVPVSRARGPLVDINGNVQCSALIGGEAPSRVNLEIGYATKSGDGATKVLDAMGRLAEQLRKVGRVDEADQITRRLAEYGANYGQYESTVYAGAANMPADRSEITMMPAAVFSCI